MLKRSLPLWAALVVLNPALADSFTSSVASSASKSVGSLSDSVGKSSESSSGETQVQAGPYQVLALAPAPERPGRVRLSLQGQAPLDAQQTLWLELPATLVAAQQLQAGEQLRLSLRSYGLAVSRADAAEPFFLALRDPRDLATHKL